MSAAVSMKTASAILMQLGVGLAGHNALCKCDLDQSRHHHNQLGTRLMRTLAVILLTVSMAGCVQVGMNVQQDAAQAVAIANATGDTSVVGCYQALGAWGGAVEGATQLEVLTTIEAKRSAKMALQNPACLPIYGDALATLLKATPAAPFVP